MTEAMTEVEKAEIAAVPDRTRTRLRQKLTPRIDRSDAIEVNVEAGDCILLDPMCTCDGDTPVVCLSSTPWTETSHVAGV